MGENQNLYLYLVTKDMYILHLIRQQWSNNDIRTLTIHKSAIWNNANQISEFLISCKISRNYKTQILGVINFK
jgi:hypothetical protein